MHRDTWLGCLVIVNFLSLTLLSPAEASDPASRGGITQLKGILSGDQSEVARINAAEALAKQAPQREIPDLRDKRKKTGEPETLTFAAADAALVDALLLGLHDKACSVRYICRQALGKCGREALDGLILKLADKDPDVRSYALDTLGDIALYPDAPEMPLEKALPALQKSLTDKDYRVRVIAALACWRFKDRAAPVFPTLLQLFDDDEWSVADAAVRAVAAVDPSGRKSVPALIAVMDNKKHDLREFACNGLASLGQNAKPAIPALIQLLSVNTESWYVGKSAADALAAIVSVDEDYSFSMDAGSDESATVIAALAESGITRKPQFVSDARLVALTSCKCPIGPGVVPALPLLRQLLKDSALGKYRGVALRDLTQFMAVAGKHEKDKTIAYVKEMISDRESDQGSVTIQLSNLLKSLEEVK